MSITSKPDNKTDEYWTKIIHQLRKPPTYLTHERTHNYGTVPMKYRKNNVKGSAAT